ncbi:MAG: sigma factor-like helix-turn-helix DNA-binding protein [Kibdelosporangium sp.]
MGHSVDAAIAGAVRGDRRALEQLLATLRPLVTRYCRARIGRRAGTFAAADTIAVDAMRAVLAALPTYRQQPFLGFVHKLIAPLVRAVGRTEAGPWLLKELTEAQREVIVLRVAVGLSAEETAEALGSTAATIRIAQHRALNRMRKASTPIESLGCSSL